jgi:hypothetical protein
VTLFTASKLYWRNTGARQLLYLYCSRNTGARQLLYLYCSRNTGARQLLYLYCSRNTGARQLLYLYCSRNTGARQLLYLYCSRNKHQIQHMKTPTIHYFLPTTVNRLVLYVYVTVHVMCVCLHYQSIPHIYGTKGTVRTLLSDHKLYTQCYLITNCMHTAV